jgi:hypothetical protein
MEKMFHVHTTTSILYGGLVPHTMLDGWTEKDLSMDSNPLPNHHIY